MNQDFLSCGKIIRLLFRIDWCAMHLKPLKTFLIIFWSFLSWITALAESSYHQGRMIQIGYALRLLWWILILILPYFYRFSRGNHRSKWKPISIFSISSSKNENAWVETHFQRITKVLCLETSLRVIRQVLFLVGMAGSFWGQIVGM